MDLNYLVTGGLGFIGSNFLIRLLKKKNIKVYSLDFESKDSKASFSVYNYINEEYDKGDVLFQAKCSVKGLSSADIAKEVLKLEHAHFPRVIETLL